MNRKLFFLTAVAAAALGWCDVATAESPVGSAFTYQGRLTENGQPANGPFDMWVRLYDSPAAGTLIGNPLYFLSDIPVTDGLFNITLDFGATAFTGNARWLELQVRPGGSGGLYTTLTPRHPLTAAPYAVHALNGGNWTAVGTAITNANTGFVGINRSTPISSAEFFGIQAPVQSGYGGMYLRTDGATAKPFYGYSTGTESAWSYLDGASGDWRLNVGGDRMTVTDTGRVGIGITSPSSKLHVHNGVGSSDHSLYAVTYGSGKAALFESHQSNSTPAVSIYKNQGTALQTTGDVKVNGKLYSEIGGTPRRATPIAYCTFTATETPEIVSSSGNVAVIWANDPFFPHWIATVTGETDASSWVVLSNLMMQYSHLSGGIFNLRTGTPQSPGVFKIAMQCVQNCDDSELYGNIYINFVIYKP